MTDQRRPNNGELLQKIVSDMAEIKTDIAVIKRDVINTNDLVIDHEARIRELEKARWKSAWLTGVLSAVVTSSLVALILRMVG